ncbi:MAG: hypothetical protein ACXABY_19020 [Candidatus Thorarchaeota archaeon]|jgi:hypothetical protein
MREPRLVNPFTGNEEDLVSFEELLAAYKTLFSVLNYNFKCASRGRFAIEGYMWNFYPKETQKAYDEERMI